MIDVLKAQIEEQRKAQENAGEARFKLEKLLKGVQEGREILLCGRSRGTATSIDLPFLLKDHYSLGDITKFDGVILFTYHPKGVDRLVCDDLNSAEKYGIDMQERGIITSYRAISVRQVEES